MHTEFYWRWIHLIIVLAFSMFFIFLTFVGAFKINHSGKQASSKLIAPKNAVKLEIQPGKVSEAAKGQGAFMSWENLSYAVDVKVGRKKEKLPLLQGINGFVRPGMLMALMGPSGAGKSTLLDVLGNRKTGGHIEGKILVNGSPRNQFFNRFTAYVEQMDMLMPLASVYETILFSAQTRLPGSLTKGEIELRIKDTMHILDLESIQGMMAGALSMEQRKRLTIAVELVSDPQLLFLDEPTSGLDSQAAMKVMEVVKRVAETGRAVICTIHQPSLAVFSYFDYLLLLKRGGKTVYFGPTGKDCSAVLEYFASIGWECAPKRNPADFILDAAAITSEHQHLLEKGQEDPEEAFLGSALKTEQESHLNDVPAGFVAPHFEGKYASGFVRQLECNLRRSWANVRRRTQDLRARTMRSILMGVIIGTLFLQLKHNQKGANDRFGLLFFTLIIMGTSANNAVPNIVGERAVFYREMAAGAYRALTYMISLVLTEMPVTLFTSFLLSVIAYWLAGLQSSAGHFFFFAWMIFVYGSTTMGFVMFVSLATPNGEVAQALVGVATSVFSLFAGFIITRPNIPDYWIWMYYFNLMHYPLEAVVVNEMEGQTFGCPNNEGAVWVPIPSANTTKPYCPITSGADILKGLDFKVDNKFPDMGISIGFWFAMVLASFLALRFIRHIKR
jgi:ABC-type multidrug transport system ATPase subunit